MSYSEFINVYKIDGSIDFRKVVEVCNLLHKIKLEKDGYWDEDQDIFLYIGKKLKEEQDDLADKQNYLFIFCNHDGINDEEIYKCHRIFCKILNALFSCLVTHHSDFKETKTIYDEDNNEYKLLCNHEEKFQKIKDFVKKEKLLKELEDCKDLNLEDLKIE